MQHHLFYRLLIISCTFFLISCQQTIECYLIPSTEKASDFYKVQPRNSGTLFLAKNEAEHIQIVFKGCPGETYKIHRNENADNSIRYSCRQIKSVYGFDDALVPIDGEQVTLNDSIAKLWITFHTAESTRPGKYEEQISIDGNGKRQKIKIDLQVYDTTLPSTPSLPAAFGIIEKNLIDSASKEQTLQNKLEWAELCLDYRMNPYFSTWLANSMKHEASSSPWKWNDKRTKPTQTHAVLFSEAMKNGGLMSAWDPEKSSPIYCSRWTDTSIELYYGAAGKSVPPDSYIGQSMPMPNPTHWLFAKTSPRATVC